MLPIYLHKHIYKIKILTIIIFINNFVFFFFNFDFINTIIKTLFVCISLLHITHKLLLQLNLHALSTS